MKPLRIVRAYLAQSWAEPAPSRATAAPHTDSRPVVVGVDGTDTDPAVLAWATREAALRGVELVLVHAWQPASVDRAPYAPSCEYGHDKIEADRARDALAAAEKAAHALDPAIRIRSIATADRAAPVLLEAAEHAAMLVLGRKRRSDAAHSALGPVARACARRAACPVVTVAATPEPVPAGPNGPSRQVRSLCGSPPPPRSLKTTDGPQATVPAVIGGPS